MSDCELKPGEWKDSKSGGTYRWFRNGTTGRYEPSYGVHPNDRDRAFAAYDALVAEDSRVVIELRPRIGSAAHRLVIESDEFRVESQPYLSKDWTVVSTGKTADLIAEIEKLKARLG